MGFWLLGRYKEFPGSFLKKLVLDIQIKAWYSL